MSCRSGQSSVTVGWSSADNKADMLDMSLNESKSVSMSIGPIDTSTSAVS